MKKRWSWQILPALLILLTLLLAACSTPANPTQGSELGGLRRVMRAEL